MQNIYVRSSRAISYWISHSRTCFSNAFFQQSQDHKCGYQRDNLPYYINCRRLHSIIKLPHHYKIRDNIPAMHLHICSPTYYFLPNQNRSLSIESPKKSEHKLPSPPDDPEKKLSLVQKFKLMYKQYWYVLIPVHVVTSIVWFGSFFIMAKSGVDIVPMLEYLGASEGVLSHLRTSDAGYVAIAYAMYKIATPARYTVTLGGTTISIKYLKEWGYIKPVPSSDQLREMYSDKKEELIERKEEVMEKYNERKEDMKEKYHGKKEEILERYQEKKVEFKDMYQEKRENIKDRFTVKNDNLNQQDKQDKDR